MSEENNILRTSLDAAAAGRMACDLTLGTLHADVPESSQGTVSTPAAANLDEFVDLLQERDDFSGACCLVGRRADEMGSDEKDRDLHSCQPTAENALN